MRLEPQVFAQDNARNEGIEEIVRYFVPTEPYWQLFSKRHQVVLGCRGSGKTALMKMASFPYVVKFQDAKAKALAADLMYFGIHVSTDLRFVGSLKNKVWQNAAQEERYFVWKFNANCLKSFLVAAPAILDHVFGETITRFSAERDLCVDLSSRIFTDRELLSFADLIEAIEDYEDRKRVILSKQFAGSDDVQEIDALSVELCDPIRWCARFMGSLDARLIGATWLVCIDEAEFLTGTHFRIINSFMRAFSENIFLKIATMPYHHSLDTNLGMPIQADEDFDYIYIDENRGDPTNSATVRINEFAERIFENRQIRGRSVGRALTLTEVLGVSVLDVGISMPKKFSLALETLRQHCDAATIARANELREDRKKFGNEIWRKVAGLIQLRESLANAAGRREMTVYCGASIISRCTDGVPRRMINLFHQVASLMEEQHAIRLSRGRIVPGSHAARAPGLAKLSPKKQTTLMKDFSERRFIQSLTVPKVGPSLNEFLDDLGKYFADKLHQEKISSDIIISFRADEHTPDKYWDLIKFGIAYGFIFPNAGSLEWLKSSKKAGTFRLSYSLSPKYNLMPRRGKDRAVQRIVKASRRNNREDPSQGRFEFPEE